MAFVLPIMAAVSTIAGTALSAYGAIQQGQAAKSAGRYNEIVQKQQADQAMNIAGQKASNESVKTRQRVAAARAGAIQNGFETDGSVGDILRTVETQGALEGLTAMWEGGVRAQGLRSSAELSRASGDNAETAGYIGAGSSLLSGFSKMYTGGRNSFS